MSPRDCYPVAAVARALGVTPRQVGYAIEAGRVGARQWDHGAHRFIHRDELRRYAQALGLRVDWNALNEMEPAEPTELAEPDARNYQNG